MEKPFGSQFALQYPQATAALKSRVKSDMESYPTASDKFWNRPIEENSEGVPSTNPTGHWATAEEKSEASGLTYSSDSRERQQEREIYRAALDPNADGSPTPEGKMSLTEASKTSLAYPYVEYPGEEQTTIPLYVNSKPVDIDKIRSGKPSDKPSRAPMKNDQPDRPGTSKVITPSIPTADGKLLTREQAIEMAMNPDNSSAQAKKQQASAVQEIKQNDETGKLNGDDTRQKDKSSGKAINTGQIDRAPPVTAATLLPYEPPVPYS